MAALPESRSTRNIPSAILCLAAGSPSLYGAPYIVEIRKNFLRRHTRREMRRIFNAGTGRQVPPAANLRKFVAKWHAHQQAINAGEIPSAFWREASIGYKPV